MKRICVFILVILIAAVSVQASAATLPSPAEFNADVTAPSFTMTAIGGQTLASSNYGAGKNLLMVYGRIGCWNTRSFLSGIQEGMGDLTLNGITVLVGLHDDPTDEEMTEFANTFTGIVCGKVSNYYSESGMWTGLSAVGAATNSVTFPVIFLRSSEGKIRYYSTGYVYEPLTVVSAAIRMSRGDFDVSNAELILPDELRIIEENAFRNDKFESVYCQGNVTTIGAYAFAGNAALEWIYLPPSVTKIDKTAFNGCSQLTIYGKAGSYAQQYADANQIEFMELEP